MTIVEMFETVSLLFLSSVLALESDLNVNDFLRTDLMPTYFMVEHDGNSMLASDTVGSVNGSIDAALSTLDYHRQVHLTHNRHYQLEDVNH